jgi:Na+-driven multidrug efflux pump
MNQTQNFLKLYLPFLLSFICGRLVLQTDLFMISRLGANAIAAHAVPMRIMFLDVILAFSLSPVISVLVASQKNPDDIKNKISLSIQMAIILSILTTVICLFIYPIIAKFSIHDLQVLDYANQAIFWLTLSIPTRLVQFAGSMALHGLSRGSFVIKISIIEIITNLVGNILFMNILNLGFKGSYISTLASSLIVCSITMYALRNYIHFKLFFKFSKEHLIFLKNLTAEFGRILSERVVAYFTLISFTFNSLAGAGLVAFSVAFEIYNLLTVPLIALMRASAIYWSQEGHTGMKELIQNQFTKSLLKWSMILSTIVSLLWVLFSSKLTSLYGINSNILIWWNTFVVFFALTIPTKTINLLLKGAHQSFKNLKHSFYADLFSHWAVLLPILFLGYLTHNPFYYGLSFLVSEVASLMFLGIYSFKVNG